MIQDLVRLIGSIRLPGCCISIADSGLAYDVVDMDARGDTVKVVLDFKNKFLERQELFVLYQKIVAASRYTLGSNVVLKSAFMGEKIDPDINRMARGGIDLSRTFEPIAGVGKIVAVCSNKGGVGKSTVAGNLAIKLAQSGSTVGLIDADIYSSSIPIIFGIGDNKIEQDGGLLQPIEQYSIKIVSIGLIVSTEVPIVWRGPMLSKALHKLMRQTNWGEVDYLIVDTPPGTGDIHISLLQSYPMDSVVTVCTNDQMSRIGAAKTERFFTSFGVPVISRIMNMSNVLGGYDDCVPLCAKIAEGNAIGRPFALDDKVPFCENTVRNILEQR